jgi:hypothetical protein
MGDQLSKPTLEYCMSLSLFDFCVPAFTVALTNLSNQIDKASAYAERKKFDTKALADARLIVDMHPFSRQVQISCDNAKGTVARLAGIDIPQHPDTETTFAELKTRIARTVDFIQSTKREQFAGAEAREVLLQFPGLTLKFTAQDYLTKFALPNFYFHFAMAYAILRENGVELGKGDFLGAVQ